MPKGVHPRKRKTLAQRFWAKVEKRGPDECWSWAASVNGDGYGQIWSDRKLRAHCVSWELHNGPIPQVMQVLHTCDNPRCVNPAHLFLGTHDDNMADKTAKGRAARRLTENDVWMIRDTYADGGVSQEALGKYFRVSLPMIHFVIRRKCWRHVP